MVLKTGFFFSKQTNTFSYFPVFSNDQACSWQVSSLFIVKVGALSECKVRSVLVMFSVFRSCTVRMLIFIMFSLHFIVKHIATAGQFTAFNLLSPCLKEGT